MISKAKILVYVATAVVLRLNPAMGQMSDVVSTPNTEHAGIHKSLGEQVGAGRGDVTTPDSSIFIIRRDPFRSIRRGRQIFQRKFRIAEGFGPRKGPDGLGALDMDPEFGAGLVDSCAGCHGRPRGSAGFGGDVFTRPDSRDAPHLFGLGLQEMLADEITSDLRQIRSAAIAEAARKGKSVTFAMTSKGINYGQIRAFPDGTVDSRMIRGVDGDLRVKPFFAHGANFSIRQFAAGALQAEMGLQAVDPDLLSAHNGGTVTTPSGMVIDGALDKVNAPPADSRSDDPDGDGVANEVDTALLDHLEFYLLNYFRPAAYKQTDQIKKGRKVFESIACNSCHVPNLLINHDRRVADVDTVYDPVKGIFNNLFATAKALVEVFDDGSGFPTLKLPAGQPFLVKDIFTDFKRHDLGPAFHEIQFDGTTITQFMTEPLWGVGSTAPYGHDGRSMTLEEVILRHGGEAQASRDAFVALDGGGSGANKAALLAFLNSLILFPPDDTASNLDPGNPSTPGFPQRGHGSIKLTVLFNDPTDLE